MLLDWTLGQRDLILIFTHVVVGQGLSLQVSAAWPLPAQGLHRRCNLDQMTALEGYLCDSQNLTSRQKPENPGLFSSEDNSPDSCNTTHKLQELSSSVYNRAVHLRTESTVKPREA